MAGRSLAPALVVLARLLVSRLLVAAAVVAAAGPAGAQSPPENLATRIAGQYRAVELYRSGDTEGAVRLLEERTLDEQHDLVVRILRLARARLHEQTEETDPWTHQVVAAFAALHMEAALHAYTGRDPLSKVRARTHVALAEPLSAFAASWPLRKSSDRRWELALGLTALSDGELGWAEWFLEPACRTFPDDVPLLVACGTVEETRATMTATTPWVRISDDMVRRFRAMRADWLNRAEKQLARAFRADLESIEARLRLAHVRAMQGDMRAAAPLLEDIGSGKLPADLRSQYLPVSVVLALDVSASVTGEPLANLKTAAAKAMDALRPDDESALLTFSQRVSLRAGWTRNRAALPGAVEMLGAGGLTALYDAVFAGIGLRERAAGRTVLLVFSDGFDTASWLEALAVIQAARRSDIVVYAVSAGQELAGPPVEGSARGVGDARFLRRAFEAEPNLFRFAFLQELTTDTGGELIHVNSTGDLSRVFTGIVESFKTRYVLTYTPTSVPAPGWHPIEVKLKGKEGTIRARRGYVR